VALRPASKTLSSLIGLLVLAAVLWLLLNFVYAPSCGRFSCDYEPAWLPQAQADAGCPDSIRQAVHDERWLRDRLESIQDEKITTGVLYDEDGMAHRFVSGRDDAAATALKVGQDAGIFPAGGTPFIVDHVEVKVAAVMRHGGVKSGVLVINKDDGPCDPAMPNHPFTCQKILPKLLGTGARLWVFWLDEDGQVQSDRFSGSEW
jgi:SCP1.201-like deaminase